VTQLRRQDPLSELEREELGDRVRKMTRRGMVGGLAGISALAGTLGVGYRTTAAEAFKSVGLVPEDLPAKQYKAITVEVLAASTWVSHGMETAKFFGDLLGVEVSSFDGQGQPELQLQALLDAANQDFDFIALHPSSSDALIDGADAIIESGKPFIIMDTRLIQDPAANAEYPYLTYIEPDNLYMGSTVANELFKAIGGEGQVIHTQGALGHTGAQGRAEGFNLTAANYPGIEVVDETPANWLPDEAFTLWQDLLQRYPDVKGGYFHSDDMALGARAAVESAGMQDQVKIVGVDGLRNACEAILQDRLTATVINPSGRIHGGAIWAGYYQVSGTDNYTGFDGNTEIPKFIRADGGPIVKENALGYLWLHDNFQY